VQGPITCNRTAPDAMPRLDVPDPAASPDGALRRTAAERAAAPCAASCEQPLPSCASAAALTALSAAWTLLFSDSLLLTGAASALAATPLRAAGTDRPVNIPLAATQSAPCPMTLVLCADTCSWTVS